MDVASSRERVGCVGYGGGLEVDLDRGAGEDETFFGREVDSCEVAAVRGFCALLGVDLLGLGGTGLPVNRGNLLFGGGVLELFEDLTLCSGSLNLVASRSSLVSITSFFACRLGVFLSWGCAGSSYGKALGLRVMTCHQGPPDRRRDAASAESTDPTYSDVHYDSCSRLCIPHLQTCRRQRAKALGPTLRRQMWLRLCANEVYCTGTDEVQF